MSLHDLYVWPNKKNQLIGLSSLMFVESFLNGEN